MIDAIKFVQNDNTFFIAKMKIEDLVNHSSIPLYNSQNNTGYQRPLILSHVKKIAKYLYQESSPLLPSAIIAAINNGDYSFSNGKLVLNNKMRIVDGQHRIEGIKSLQDKKRTLDIYNHIKESYELPIIILVVDGDDSIEEMDTFINLNNKGKRVKTDLAEILKAKKLENRTVTDECLFLEDDLFKKISIDLVKALNKQGFWKDLIIQADENGSRSNQPISLLAFFRAIKPVVKNYIESNWINKSNRTINQDDLSQIESELLELIQNVWSLVIEKWQDCFIDGGYDPSYNICKALGVAPIFRLYAEMCKNKDSIDSFKHLLEKSPVKPEDWSVGGLFSGFASAKGFSIIEQYIKGEISAEELEI